MQEYPDIAQWRLLAEKALNRGCGRDWSEYDFEKVSDLIYEKTGDRLSVSTLKRIWGRIRYESSPATATLNVLARFVDFPDWRGFQHSLHTQPDAAPTTEPRSHAPAPTLRAPSNRLRMALVGGLIACSAAVLFLSIRPRFSSPAGRKVPSVLFESRKTSDDLPNSVVFTYDVSALHSDNVYIQQSWDTTRREKVPGDGHYHTSIYYKPGFFKAKLIVDGQIKKISEIFIKSHGWMAIIEKAPIPIYLDPSEIQLPGSLGITGSTLEKKTGAPPFSDRWVLFSNVKDLPEMDPSDFSLRITLRNTSTLEQSPCRNVVVYVLGKESAIILPLSAKGCISGLNLLAGDTVLSGKENDLSAFGCDFTTFHELQCRVSDHRFKVFLDTRPILDIPQHRDIGSLVGVRVGFEGAGEFRDLSLESHGRQADLR